MSRPGFGILGSILLPTLIALGFALVTLGVVVYLMFYSQMYLGLDGILKSKAEGLIDSIDIFWSLEGKDRNARAEFISFARTWVSEKSPDSVLLNAVVQISDESGIIATSRNISFTSRRPVASGETITLETWFSDGKTIPLRFYAQDVPENNRPRYRILVGQPVSSIESATNSLRAALVLIIPAVLILLALTISLITRRALKPLGNIVSSMERVSARNLSDHVSVGEGTREIVALGKSFDTMLERLDLAFREEHAFIADLSHQIKTPLAVIRGQLETTLRKERSRTEYEEVLESGLEEINTLSGIIEKLLLLARYDSREIQPDFCILDLSAEIQILVDDFVLLAKSRDLPVHLSLVPGALVLADRNMIRQVFINLFDNAVKYAFPGTDIRITVSPVSGGIRFSVRNFGAVIDSGDIPHLFERFRRFDKSGVSGFGLGLSIVEAIARQHGSVIHVHSETATGTEFALVFPVAQPAAC
jgi:heavy metal sensor kinase